jgi:NifU-like protein involved in Fe-S cluster formation
VSKLYTPAMLALTTELALYPFTDKCALTAQGRSSVCGSTMELGVDLDAEGRISRIGLRVSACAVGQSSAAIMASAAEGRTPTDMHDILQGIRSWLGGEGNVPDWPRFEALEAALAHPGRHGALLLPWETVAKAVSAAS